MFTRHAQGGAGNSVFEGTDPGVVERVRPITFSRHRLRPRPGGAQQVVGGCILNRNDAGHGTAAYEDDVWILNGYTNASCTCKPNEPTRSSPQVNLGGLQAVSK